MNPEEPEYALEPTTFHSMREAQELTDLLEENLQGRNMGAANTHAEAVEIFSELVNNAAEHGMTPEGAHAHVRFMPHRRGHAFDLVVTDPGPGIRATLAHNPGMTQPETDSQAIGLAVQELVSGAGNPTRGIGLWMTLPTRERDRRSRSCCTNGPKWPTWRLTTASPTTWRTASWTSPSTPSRTSRCRPSGGTGQDTGRRPPQTSQTKK